MSVVDSRLSPHLRTQYLTEVRSWLPAFLVGASTERTEPLTDVQELLNLDGADLRRTLAVHILRHEAVSRFMRELPGALRSPDLSSVRPPELTRAVTGGIDWAATSRVRCTSSPIEPLFVVRRATRDFDTAGNRVLAWVIRSLTRELKHSGLAGYEAQPGTWRGELAAGAPILQGGRRVAWIRDIAPERPSARDFDQVGIHRRRFYRETLSEAAAVLRRFEDPDVDDVVSFLADRWFEPERDWALFELVVLLRCERMLASLGTRQRLRIAGAGSGAFARIRMPSGSLVQLWYQAWPRSTDPSELVDAIKHYGLKAGGSRPDVVVEHIPHDGPTQAILLELKASESAEYLASGFLQLLGYLRDRPAVLTGEARGWLVAPATSPLRSNAADGRSLWAVSDDLVADAVTSTISQWDASAGIECPAE